MLSAFINYLRHADSKKHKPKNNSTTIWKWTLVWSWSHTHTHTHTETSILTVRKEITASVQSAKTLWPQVSWAASGSRCPFSTQKSTQTQSVAPGNTFFFQKCLRVRDWHAIQRGGQARPDPRHQAFLHGVWPTLGFSVCPDRGRNVTPLCLLLYCVRVPTCLTHTHLHSRTHAHTCTHARANTHTHAHAHGKTHAHTHLHVYTCRNAHIHKHTSMHTHAQSNRKWYILCYVPNAIFVHVICVSQWFLYRWLTHLHD